MVFHQPKMSIISFYPVDRLVDGDPADPGGQGTFSPVLKSPDPVKCLDERFQHQILRLVIVPDISFTEHIHPDCISSIQFILRHSVSLRAVPGQRLLIQFFIHSRLCLYRQSYTHLRKGLSTSFQQHPGQLAGSFDTVAMECLPFLVSTL